MKASDTFSSYHLNAINFAFIIMIDGDMGYEIFSVVFFYLIVSMWVLHRA